MNDEEARARVEDLVETFDGIVWERLEGVSDLEHSAIALRAYGHALVNACLKAASEEVYKQLLEEPERARSYLSRAILHYPWEVLIARVLEEHERNKT